MTEPHMSFLRRLVNSTRDLLFPPRCIGCDDLLPPFEVASTVFCPDCLASWNTARTEAAVAAAEDATKGHVYLTFYHSGETDGIPERLIFHLKHRGDSRAFSFVADVLTFSTRMAVLAADSDAADATSDEHPRPVFTYPPRRRAAVREDGFDQAARLSRALAKTCGGESASLLCRTRRPTAEQKKLDATSRTQNASRSYALRKQAVNCIQGRTIVLCDDLCTTGATLAACSTLLLEAGARCVVWATVAQTRNDRMNVP